MFQIIFIYRCLLVSTAVTITYSIQMMQQEFLLDYG